MFRSCVKLFEQSAHRWSLSRDLAPMSLHCTLIIFEREIDIDIYPSTGRYHVGHHPKRGTVQCSLGYSQVHMNLIPERQRQRQYPSWPTAILDYLQLCVCLLFLRLLLSPHNLVWLWFSCVCVLALKHETALSRSENHQ